MSYPGKFFLLIAALFISFMLISTGTVMASDLCQKKCAVETKKSEITIAILPDADGQWPVVVEYDNDTNYSCGSDPKDYPCLAWPYQCVSGSCEEITKAYILIPNCCDNPINITQTSQGEPDIVKCTSTQSHFPNVCSGYELQIENISGKNPPPEGLFWFTTQSDINPNMIDISIPVGSLGNVPCLTGIKGPGCASKVSPVRVEPRSQCWQFTAENTSDACPEAQDQTWYAEWEGSDPCAAEVWVADGIVPCNQVKAPSNKITGESLDAITITVDNVEQSLSEALDTNSKCSQGWLRFIDKNGCNVRCYRSGGYRYCY